MHISDKEACSILLERNYLSQEELDKALKEAEEHAVPLITMLMEHGLITPSLYESALCEHFGWEMRDLQSALPAADLVALLPRPVAQKFNVVVIEKTEGGITVATSDPTQKLLEEAIRKNIGKEKEEDILWPDKKPAEEKESLFSFQKNKKEKKKDTVPAFRGTIRIVYAPQDGIDAALRLYNSSLETRFQSIIEREQTIAPEILTEILDGAISLRASDIHFEPREEIVIIRFRLDGILREAGHVAKEHYEGILNRVKIMAGLRTDEHFRPQDGALRHKTNGDKVDVRVSIIPIVDGEKIVMRLLTSYVRALTLADLGFSKEHQNILVAAVQKPFGMILTTGPTGSGKSTTLSALMKMRNTPDVNISTIEDPVEYKLQGVNHIQVNTAVNLTFASGLRSLVRQDPDIILVGEIRDSETADIAVNAAMTGHLLFSTLHANTAATAIPRLLEMDTEPFLLASTLEVIIGQRLVRRICSNCRHSFTMPAQEARTSFPGAERFFPQQEEITLYKGKGCAVCAQSGYQGRVGMYELLVITTEIAELIVKRATSDDIDMMARTQGVKVMFEDGFQKVMAGVTTLEELKRIAAPPEELEKAGKDKKFKEAA